MLREEPLDFLGHLRVRRHARPDPPLDDRVRIVRQEHSRRHLGRCLVVRTIIRHPSRSDTCHGTCPSPPRRTEFVLIPAAARTRVIRSNVKRHSNILNIASPKCHRNSSPDFLSPATPITNNQSPITCARSIRAQSNPPSLLDFPMPRLTRRHVCRANEILATPGIVAH